MSALNTFRILEKGDNYIEVEVQIVHPDEHLICRSKNFSLQIILELYVNILKGHIYNSAWCSYPFTQEESKKLVLKDYEKDFDYLITLMHGEKIAISQSEYDRRVKESDYNYEDRGGGYLSGDANGCFIGLKPNYDLFCEEADLLIEKVELISFNNYPHWFDSFEVWLEYQKTYGFPQEAYDRFNSDTAANPTYRLKISLSNKGLFLLHHLIPQSFWDSAAYCYEYSASQFTPKTKNDSIHLQYNTDNDKLTSPLELNEWWTSLSDKWKQVLQINLFMQSNYLPINVISQLSNSYLLAAFSRLHPRFEFKVPVAAELKNMIQMKALFASGCELNDLHPLIYLKDLKILHLEDCNLNDISSLASLTKLEYLNISINDSLMDLSVLSKLSKLKYLYFNPLSQTDVDMLKTLTQLRKLSFDSAIEINTSVLKELSSLKEINGLIPVW